MSNFALENRRRAPFPSEELRTKMTSPISFVRILRTSLHLKIRPKDSLTEATLSVKPEGDERREVNRRRAPFHKKARPHMRIVPPKFLPSSSHVPPIFLRTRIGDERNEQKSNEEGTSALGLEDVF